MQNHILIKLVIIVGLLISSGISHLGRPIAKGSHRTQVMVEKTEMRSRAKRLSGDSRKLTQAVQRQLDENPTDVAALAGDLPYFDMSMGLGGDELQALAALATDEGDAAAAMSGMCRRCSGGGDGDAAAAAARQLDENPTDQAALDTAYRNYTHQFEGLGIDARPLPYAAWKQQVPLAAVRSYFEGPYTHIYQRSDARAAYDAYVRNFKGGNGSAAPLGIDAWKASVVTHDHVQAKRRELTMEAA